MKRIMTCMAVAAGMFAAVHGEIKTVPMTPEKQAELLAKAGGRLMPPSNGRSILLVDWCGKARCGTNDLAKVFLEQQAFLFGFPVERLAENKPAGSDAYTLLKAKRDSAHVAVLAMVDDPAMPRLAVFPEDALACVNVGAYACDDWTIFSRRITRELWRAYGFALGAYANISHGCVMQAVYDNESLDGIRTPAISQMRMNGVARAAQALGLRTMKATTYATACRQGWAPAPTNDVQKALYADAQKRLAEKAERAKRRASADGGKKR